MYNLYNVYARDSRRALLRELRRCFRRDPHEPSERQVLCVESDARVEARHVVEPLAACLHVDPQVVRAPQQALRVTPQVLWDELQVLCHESHVLRVDADDRVERFHVVRPRAACLCVDSHALCVEPHVVFIDKKRRVERFHVAEPLAACPCGEPQAL
jgi:hypothetical protein